VQCPAPNQPTTYRQATTCGGTAIGNYSGYWFFDASDKLIGVTFSIDLGSNGCGDALGFGKTTVYGKACTLEGEPTDVCATP